MTTTPTDADRIALMEQVYSSVEEVCSQLEPAEWDLPTDCPGWSVKDNLSHLVSYEALFLGRAPAPADLDVSHASWVTNDFQAFNEREVELRRSRTPAEVLEEYREVTAARSKALRDIDEETWGRETQTPVGTLALRDAIGVRTLDFFFHEQDIRRATGRPGHLDGAVAAFVFERLATLSMPRVVAKAAGAPDGSRIRFEIPGRAFTVAVGDGRGQIVEDGGAPSATLALDTETFLCLVGGRWDVERAKSEGRLTVSGDQDLAARVLGAMTVIP